MSTTDAPRRAEPADAAACAAIVNDWIDATPWMPRVHSRDDIARFVAEALPLREIWVTGEPVAGYLSLNGETGQVVALYTSRPGHGLGKALMDCAKAGRDALHLWTHEPNAAAHRFYRREGFVVADRNPLGDDGLPELRMEWRR